MLINAGVRLGGGPCSYVSGTSAGAQDRSKHAKTNELLNFYAGPATVIAGASIASRNGRPSGYLHPLTWAMPIKPGAMTMRGTNYGVGSLVATATLGAPRSLDMTGALDASLSAHGVAPTFLDITAQLTAALSLFATANPTLSITAVGAAALEGYGAYKAILSAYGFGTLAAEAYAVVSATLDMQGALTVTVNATAAAPMTLAASGSGVLAQTLIGVFPATAALLGTGTMTLVAVAIASPTLHMQGSLSPVITLSALANMELHITNEAATSEVTPSSVAAAVWAHATATTLTDAVALIRRISDNRLEIDFDAQRLVLYADDGTTELRSWPLATDGGEDVSPIPGVQTKRGAGV